MNDKHTNSKAQAIASDAISQKLRQFYDSITEEAIPDKFLDLLEKLDEADKAHGLRSRNEEGGNGH